MEAARVPGERFIKVTPQVRPGLDTVNHPELLDALRLSTRMYIGNMTAGCPPVPPLPHPGLTTASIALTPAPAAALARGSNAPRNPPPHRIAHSTPHRVPLDPKTGAAHGRDPTLPTSFGDSRI